MKAPVDLDALEAIANELGFTMHRRAFFVDSGIDASYTQIASVGGMKLRLGSDRRQHALEFEFEGTPRECAAFLMGWRDAQHEAAEVYNRSRR